MSSPPLPPQSDDDLFNPQRERPWGFETIETVPLTRRRESPEHDTLITLPPIPNGQSTQRRGVESQSQLAYKHGNTQGNTYQTQPTQLLDLPSEISSPPASNFVQVTASSPISAPAPPVRRPNGILASAMAPAGTTFRRPYVAPATARRTEAISINSDDDDHAVSSDSDRAERARSNIKTSTFKRAADKIPESPQAGSGLSKFQQITQGSIYRKTDYASGLKRSSDVMANAYGNASKKMRQTGPARATPVGSVMQEDSDMDLEDIQDFNARSKVRRMRSTLSQFTIREMYQALQAKKGNFDDAMEYLTNTDDQKVGKSGQAIDLTGSDDELMMTPAATKKKAAVKASIPQDTRQQAKKPTKSINEKWSSTQALPKKPHNKQLDVFDDPGPAVPKPRKLIRGRRDPSPSSQASTKNLGSKSEKSAIVLSDQSDSEADSGIKSDGEDGDFDSRVLSFFNTCTAMDLADTASISRDIADRFVSQQPFRSIKAVNSVENPNLKTSKSRRKAAPIGEKIVDKVYDMLRSYEAVDYLVKKCESIARPLATEMKSWGVDVYGKAGPGELDMTDLQAQSQASGSTVDSGLGTPISDDDQDSLRGSGLRALVGQPASMAEDVVMKDYQIVGLNWLNLLFRKRYSCILADDMGLGKTMQTIALLAHLAETGIKGPSLIVVPAATLENWLKEFARFCPGLAVEPYYATQLDEKLELQQRIDDMRDEINVIVTTYTLAKAKNDFPWLKDFGFCCTIFDEGHVLKNADSKVSRNLMRIKTKWRLLLTGTPLQNNLRELMSLLSFLMPDIFKSKKDELEVIFKQDVKTINEDAESRKMLLSKKRIDKARGMLTPFILRRKKWQVLKDLPKKERRLEYCEFTQAQSEIYNGWLAKAFDIRERRANGERVPGDESTNILMRLRQAAIHPLLFRHHYRNSDLAKIAKACLKDPQWEASNPDLIFTELVAYSDFEVHQLCVKSKPLQKFILSNNQINNSGKVHAMIKLLKQFMSQGHRTLIFSQFVMVLDILELVLSDHGIKFFRLDGNTKVSERQDLIDEFNEEIDEDAPDAAAKRELQVPVFMLSTKAGGAGINLASASRVIVFDSGFNPQDDVQAENRAHRIGQKKEVEVWRLVTRGSVEEQIHDMGIVKLRLDQEVAGEGAQDLDEGQSKAYQKDMDDKEVEGRKTVEEMFFKEIGEAPTMTARPPSNAQSDYDTMRIDENEHEKQTSGAKVEEIATAHDISAVTGSSDDNENEADKEEDDDDGDDLPRNRKSKSKQPREKDISLPARSKRAPARPKASRKNRSQSQSQSQSQKQNSASQTSKKSSQTKLSFGTHGKVEP